MNTVPSKPKSQEDFVRSQYYEGFVKFGRSCIRNEYLEPEKFAEWLIKNGKKLADWHKDKMNNESLLMYVNKEPGLQALERTIIYLSEWANDNSKEFNEYFREVSTPRAVHDIRSAKVSPWVIYLSDSGNDLLRRFTSEQVEMIKDIIDSKFWMKVFLANKEEVSEIKQTCQIAGL